MKDVSYISDVENLIEEKIKSLRDKIIQLEDEIAKLKKQINEHSHGSNYPF